MASFHWCRAKFKWPRKVTACVKALDGNRWTLVEEYSLPALSEAVAKVIIIVIIIRADLYSVPSTSSQPRSNRTVFRPVINRESRATYWRQTMCSRKLIPGQREQSHENPALSLTLSSHGWKETLYIIHYNYILYYIFIVWLFCFIFVLCALVKGQSYKTHNFCLLQNKGLSNYCNYED